MTEDSSMVAGCNQDNVSFVLVRPVYLGNIGSVARSMKNFAFNNMVLIEPPNNYKDAEARMMAVGAFDVLKHSTVFKSVEEAVQDATLIYGTTCGRQRSQNLMSLQEAAVEAIDISKDNKIVFMFGDEVNGLGTEDLSRCHRLVYIPTNPEFSSLNLSHAVATVAYELTRQNEFGTVLRHTSPKYTRRILPTVAEENEFFDLMEQFLTQIDFLRAMNKHVVLDDIRRFYQKINPTKRELDLVRGSLHKLRLALKPQKHESKE